MIAFSSNINGNWDVFVTTSLDGVNWSEPIAVATDASNETDPSLIKTANGYMIAYSASNLIWVISSTTGEDWGEPLQVTSIGDWGHSYVEPSLVEVNGSYILAYSRYVGGWIGRWYEIALITSDNGVNWTQPLVVNETENFASRL